MKRFASALIAALGLAASAAGAQTSFPAARPVTIIVPFAAGSGTDTVARVLTAAMAHELKGATFVIDNRSGANGIVGATAAAKSAPDGYTLFLTTLTTQSVNPYIYPTLPYDPNADFAPIGLLGETAPALLTTATNPANTVDDLLDKGRHKPGDFNVASTNSSSLAAAQLFEKRAGAKLVIIKYKAAPQALTDTMTGVIDYFFGDLASGGSLVKNGKLKALAVLSDRRLPGFEQVPTMAEAGHPGLEVPIWIGLFAPKGISPELVERINHAMVAAQGRPEVIDALATAAVNVRTTSAAEFAVYVADQYQRWGKFAKEVNLQSD